MIWTLTLQVNNTAFMSYHKLVVSDRLLFPEPMHACLVNALSSPGLNFTKSSTSNLRLANALDSHILKKHGFTKKRDTPSKRRHSQKKDKREECMHNTNREGDLS